MKTKRTLVGSLLALMTCGTMMAGATYALFTSQAKLDVVIKSAKVDVEVAISDIVGTSQNYNSVLDTYETVTNDEICVVDTETGDLLINHMKPLDKVDFKLKLTNKSDIDVKYRLSIKSKYDTYEAKKLLSVLDFSMNNNTYNSIVGYTSAWSDFTQETEEYTFSMAMGDIGNEYQGLTSGLSFKVEAIQGNAKTEGEETFEYFTTYDGTPASKEELDSIVIDTGTVDENGKKNSEVTINDAEDLSAVVNNINSYGNLSVDLQSDVDVTGEDWTSVTIDGYSMNNKGTFIIDGHGKTIYGLNQPFLQSTWSSCNLIVKNLNIENAQIHVTDTGSNGVGAFIGMINNGASLEEGWGVTFENCHVNNSSIDGGHWNGGIYGYAAGYSGAGPMDTIVNIKNCSVTNSYIGKDTDDASSGACMGHATGDKRTYVTVTDSMFNNNVIRSLKENKAGSLLGTSGAGQVTFTNCTYLDNDVKGNGVTITRPYGRLAYSNDDSFLNINGELQ